jgi:hypothetical protein
MVVAFFVCWLWLLYFIQTFIHHNAWEPFWLPCNYRFLCLTILFWDGQAYRCVSPLYAYCLLPFEVTQFLLVGMLARVVLFLWLLCPFYLSNTQGLCFVKAQYFLSVLYKSRILQPGFSLLFDCVKVAYLGYNLYDFLYGHLYKF